MVVSTQIFIVSPPCETRKFSLISITCVYLCALIVVLLFSLSNACRHTVRMAERRDSLETTILQQNECMFGCGYFQVST